MCGISGIFSFATERPVERAWLARMNAVQQHRGPDDEGVYVSGRIGLGNRRLAIVDRENGRQPMATPDGALWVTFGGEIFEHQALRSELEGRGLRFRTRSDTEVVLRAYEAYGEGCVERLDGQFAFAIWDATKETLFLARDRLGIVPLHYAVRAGQFIFASEVKAILAHPDAAPSADLTGVAEMLLCGALFEGRTTFRDIHSLAPGHTLTVSARGCAGRCYWDIPLEAGTSPGSEEDLAERLVSRLEHAVRIRLPSEVDWGVILSGGTDSSTLCALATRLTADAVQTFTIDFPDRWKGGDTDARYARGMAAALGARHHEFLVEPERYFAAMDRLMWHLERPFNKGAASMYLIYERVRDDATVILSGEGADELFAGYMGSRGLGLDGIVRTGEITRFPWAPYWEVADRLLSAEFRRACGAESLVADRLRASLARAATGDLLNQALYLYCRHFLTELLEIHDRTSLAFGVEGRMPFLDHRFVEEFFPLPSDLKYRHGEAKHLLKRAIRGLVPEEVIHRKKTHMPIPRDPQSVYRQIEWARSLVSGPGSRTAHYYDLPRMEDFLAHRNEFADVDMVAVWQITLYLITLELQHRVFRL
jgi:asparagine synthase (glutamine-hydrolysing)